ncbi:PAS domain-containing sensor histidine kinase [Polaromonas sp. P1(28)-13]|nr:PAS domain-containing sensor histidine kinase [Polaromonas sp. P1(28)-13]
MDAIITVDEEQRIVLYNRAAEKIFGWPTAQMLGQPLARLIPERFQAAHGDHVRRFGSTGVTSRRMGGSSVVYGHRANGEEFQMDASISQLETGEGKLFTVILRDVTERLRAEQEHARLTARLSGLLDSAMDAIITVDEAQRIVLYNRAAEKIFGWPSDQALGEPLDKLMPARFRASHDEHIRRFATMGITSRRMGDDTVLYGQRAGGEEFPMEASISQLETAEGKLFTVILRDVTERVRAQEELSALASEAHAIREGEKTRIARELHDELAQSLTALKMDTIWVRDHLPGGAQAAAAKLGDMVAMLDTTVAATRRIAADLRPLLLDDLGLVPAIEWLVQTFTQRTGVACTLSADEEVELHEPYATAVFRIVQESLANVAKHAQASQAEVKIERTPDAVMLRVRDNGLGFSLAAPRKPNSLGLMGLRERAHLLKGRIDIDSQPGQGTCIDVRIPVHEAGAAD